MRTGGVWVTSSSSEGNVSLEECDPPLRTPQAAWGNASPLAYSSLLDKKPTAGSEDPHAPVHMPCVTARRQLVAASPGSLEEMTQVVFPRLCHFFKSGRCKNGSRCKWSHDVKGTLRSRSQSPSFATSVHHRLSSPAGQGRQRDSGHLGGGHRERHSSSLEEGNPAHANPVSQGKHELTLPSVPCGNLAGPQFAPLPQAD